MEGTEVAGEGAGGSTLKNTAWNVKGSLVRGSVLDTLGVLGGFGTPWVSIKVEEHATAEVSPKVEEQAEAKADAPAEALATVVEEKVAAALEELKEQGPIVTEGESAAVSCSCPGFASYYA